MNSNHREEYPSAGVPVGPGDENAEKRYQLRASGTPQALLWSELSPLPSLAVPRSFPSQESDTVKKISPCDTPIPHIHSDNDPEEGHGRFARSL